MVSEGSVDALSIAQRDVLIEHIDGARPITRAEPNRVSTIKKLVAIRLLRYDPPVVTLRPRSTILTDAGREALAMLLGRYADALVRAGYLDDQGPEDRPLQILRRLRAGAAGPRALLGASAKAPG